MRNFARLTSCHADIFAGYGSPGDIGRAGASPTIYAMSIAQGKGPTLQHVSCPAANASASEFHIIFLTQNSFATLFCSPTRSNSSFFLSYRPAGSNHRLILFFFEKSLVNGATPGHTRQLSAANNGGKL